VTYRASPTITTMSEEDALSLLQGRDVGHLSLQVDGYPLTLPVNYAVDLRPRSTDRIIIRAAPKSVIGTYRGPASIEVDHIDRSRGTAWSVLVRGDLGRVAGRRPPLDPEPFVSEGRTRWMQLVIRHVDGRRFAGDAAVRTTGRTGAADEAPDEHPAAWLDRIVTATAGTVREQLERLHAVVAPSESTE
jgi:nitroimidazol reductase NimA-like FMN-containing flavoprotein (pyridoxamine 5'-phosphate oxidase superfamily)